MLTLSINGAERTIAQRSDVDEAWIANQIGGRRKDDHPVCLVLRIDRDGVRLRLGSAGCARGKSKPKTLRAAEQVIVELWRKQGMMEDDFPPGALISFLHQVLGTR